MLYYTIIEYFIEIQVLKFLGFDLGVSKFSLLVFIFML